MSKLFTPSANSHEVMGQFCVLNWPININTPGDWELLIQQLLDRGKYAVDTAASASSALSGGTVAAPQRALWCTRPSR